MVEWMMFRPIGALLVSPTRRTWMNFIGSRGIAAGKKFLIFGRGISYDDLMVMNRCYGVFERCGVCFYCCLGRAWVTHTHRNYVCHTQRPVAAGR